MDGVLRCARPSHTHTLNPVARAPMHTPAEKERRNPNLRDAMRSYTRGWGAGAAIKEIAAAISHTHVHTRGEGSGRRPLHEVAAGPLITPLC